MKSKTSKPKPAILKIIDTLCILFTVALLATAVKCIVVVEAVDSSAPVTETETISTDAIEYVIPDIKDLPIVAEEPDPDISKYNIAKAAPYHEEYVGSINVWTDLEARMDLSEADIQKIIDYWAEDEESSLKNKSVAAAFIYAAQQTDLDPIFLLSLAGQESGWGTSKLHYDTKNPYSIGLQDDGYLDMEFGDSYQESIIQGAIWIRKNFYDKGSTTLYQMEYGEYPYATDTNWMADISDIMDISYKIISEN